MTLFFTRDHEWVRVDGEIATVGITDYAQGQLGDVVFVELPTIGDSVAAGKTSAKASRTRCVITWRLASAQFMAARIAPK